MKTSHKHKRSHKQPLRSVPMKLSSTLLLLTLLSGCGILTTQYPKPNPNNIPKGCEWVTPVYVPDDVISFSLEKNDEIHRGFLNATESNNTGWLENCTVQEKPQSKIEVEPSVPVKSTILPLM